MPRRRARLHSSGAMRRQLAQTLRRSCSPAHLPKHFPHSCRTMMPVHYWCCPCRVSGLAVDITNQDPCCVGSSPHAGMHMLSVQLTDLPCFAGPSSACRLAPHSALHSSMPAHQQIPSCRLRPQTMWISPISSATCAACNNSRSNDSVRLPSRELAFCLPECTPRESAGCID